jgi:hypothetical protein
MREARPGRGARQGRVDGAMQDRLDARGKARQKSESRQGLCARHGRAYSRGKAGQMRED